MLRRATATSKLGSSGQSFVQGTFEDMGWAASPMAQEHDNGTDVWLIARDDRRFELGVLLGAQVKNGPSYFSKPKKANGSVVGWWFAVDSGHKDYWCDHGVPHIIVLRDPATKVAYWAHLIHDRFICTGKGYKILVDKSSKVDLEHNDELIEIAAAGFQPPSWEGSAWTTDPSISGDALLRYSLLTPRIIAPHRNSGIRDLSPYQAIAVLMQLRLETLLHSQDGICTLDPTLLTQAPLWEWRFYAGLYDWVINENIDALRECVASAEIVEQRIAATICLAFAYFEDSNVVEALDALETEIEKDDASPVDHAWLIAHISQCHYDLGNNSEAQENAVLAYKIRYEVASDPTAQALAAGASYLLFFANRNDGGKLEKAIESNDTTSSWWRSQTLVSGLGRQIDEAFEQWADTSVNYTYDQASRSYRAAMLQSGLSANRTSWSYPASLYARRLLMDNEGEESITMALKLLRLSGSEKHLKNAIKTLLRTGPAAPITTMGSELDLNCSTTTSIRSDIRFVQESADVLQVEDCNRNALWAIAALSDPDEKHAYDILGILATLTPRCDRSTRSEIIKFEVSLPAVDDSIRAREHADIIGQLDPDEWTDIDIEALRNRNSDHDTLKAAIENLLVTKDPELCEKLLSRIKLGDRTALENFGSVVDLPSDVVRGAVLHLHDKVSAQVAGSKQSQALDGGIDLHDLALLNLWHPDTAKWDCVRLAIESDYFCPSRLESTILFLARSAEMVPTEIRQLLRSGLEKIVCRPQPTNHNRFTGNVDLISKAQIALNRFFPNEINIAELQRQLTSTDPHIRAAAAQNIVDCTVGCKSNLSLLGVLARDPSILVRQTSIIGLANWVVNGKEMPDSLDVLKIFLTEYGPLGGLWASNVCNLDRKDPGSAALLKELLLEHPSALVRERAAGM